MDNYQKKRFYQRSKIMLGALPLLIYLAAIFYFPLITVITDSISNHRVAPHFANSQQQLSTWNRHSIPTMRQRCVFLQDLITIKKNHKLGMIARTLNFHDNRMRRLLYATSRQFNSPPNCDSPKSVINKLNAINPLWNTTAVWNIIATNIQPYVAIHYINALDMHLNSHNSITRNIPRNRIYISILIRTFYLSILITILCLLLAYPVSYYLANMKSRYVGLLFMGILIPFWTPVLVRIVSWIVTLGGNGVVNQILLYFGLVSDKTKPQLMYNQFGTVATMTHILLPLMILSLFSIMKGIPNKLLFAARSLGATGRQAFFRVYLPLTAPGIAAGCTLVFIISLGYYITPAIVGGSQGTFISNYIEYHINSSLNWGLAASLSCILLICTLIIYWIYNRLIGLNIAE